MSQSHTIVKVQLPLFESAISEREFALIYTEGRELITRQRLSRSEFRKLNGTPKAFFFADFDKSAAKWKLYDIAPWQEW